MKVKEYYKWESLDITWDKIDMLWEDISFLIEVGNIIRGSGGYKEYVENNPWDKTKKLIGEEKTKKFIKLLCNINNIEYENISEINNFKVSVDQVKKVFENKGLEVKVSF